MKMTDAIDQFVAAVESAGFTSSDFFAEDAVLDVTIPDWRFTVRGADAICRELAAWLPGRTNIDEIHRFAMLGGEAVELSLSWEAARIPYACHQLHLIQLKDGLIAEDKAWCGGHWPADLLAEMAGADSHVSVWTGATRAVERNRSSRVLA